MSKFRQDVVCKKILNSVHLSPSYSKHKRKCSPYNFYAATMKGSLHRVSPQGPTVKRFSAENFLRPDKIGPKIAVFREQGVLMFVFVF